MNKFELSAYAVEEMNQSELETVAGGSWARVFKTLGPIGSIASLVSLALTWFNSRTEQVDESRPVPNVITQGKIIFETSDSIVVTVGAGSFTMKKYGATYIQID